MQKCSEFYLFRELKGQDEKRGLTINMDKTEYLKEGDLNVGKEIAKVHIYFKYLVIILVSSAKSKENINNKIGQGRTQLGETKLGPLE